MVLSEILQQESFCVRKPQLVQSIFHNRPWFGQLQECLSGLVSFWVLDLWNLHLMEPVVAGLGSRIHIHNNVYYLRSHLVTKKEKNMVKRQDHKNEKEEQTWLNTTTTEWQCPSQGSGLLPRRKGRCAEQCSLLRAPSLLMVDVFWEGCKRHWKWLRATSILASSQYFWNHAPQVVSFYLFSQ